MINPSLTVIVASSGRPSLTRTLESIIVQRRVGDEILISVNNDCPWGHKARNQLMPIARGDALMFIDDDDAYLPGALESVRAGFLEDPDAMHIFKMQYSSGTTLWVTPEIRLGNVSTQMVVVPNLPDKLGTWGDVYEGDYVFIGETAQCLEVRWHEDVIAAVRPL